MEKKIETTPIYLLSYILLDCTVLAHLFSDSQFSSAFLNNCDFPDPFPASSRVPRTPTNAQILFWGETRALLRAFTFGNILCAILYYFSYS